MGNSTINSANDDATTRASAESASPDHDADDQSAIQATGTAAVLANARTALGLSLEEASEATKVKAEYLGAIEQADYASLPAASYVIGFVKAYARVLGLDETTTAADYRAEMTSPQAALRQANVALHPSTGGNMGVLPVAIGPTSEHDQRKIPILAILALVAICAFVFWAFFALATSRDDRATPVKSVISHALAEDSIPNTDQNTNSITQIDPIGEASPASSSSDPLNGELIGDAPRDGVSSSQLAGANETEASAISSTADIQASKKIDGPTATKSRPDTDVDTPNADVATPNADDVIEPIPAPAPSSILSEPTPPVVIGSPEEKLPRVIRGGRGDRSPSRTITGPSTSSGAQDTDNVAQALAPVEQVETDLDKDQVSKNTANIEPAIAANKPPAVSEPSQKDGDLAPAPISGFEVEQPLTDDIIIQEASLAKSSAPRFPSRCASRARAVEEVELSFTVSALGDVENPQIVSTSNRCFNRAALQTVNKWRFNPRLENGRPKASPSKTAIVKFQR